MKNESQKLTPIPAPNEKVAPSARNWLPSRRSSWLPFKPDASTDAKNAIAQERENLIRDLSLLNTAHESEIQAKTQAFEALAKEQQHRAQAEDERMALSQQLRQAQDDLGSFGLTNKTLEKDAKELAQEKQSLSQEIAALNTSLALEAKAKAQAAEQLAQETSARKQADEEAALLLTQLFQVQEELERFYLSNKALEKDATAIAQSQRDLEAKAKTETAALQTTFTQEKAALTQEKQTLGQEITKAIAARDAEAKAKADALAQGELEAKAKVDAQRKLEAETKAKAALQNDKAALAQDKQSLSQEIAALNASLALEAKAKAQAAEQLAQETSARKQADEEAALLLTQLRQVQEELERFYLSNKALEKDAMAIAQSQRDLEAKAKTETAALQTTFAQEKAALTQEKQTLAQEITKAIAARDAEAKAKADALAQGELEAKAKVDAQRKIEAETKAKDALQNDKAALAQDKQSLSQEIAALNASLALEAKAKAQAAEQLAQETSARKQADEEAALLLMQLLQVQEGLERYYLDNKDLQASLRGAQVRFGRLVSRQPDGIDWESVQTQPLTVGGQPALRCTAVNVAVVGKEWKTLDFLAFKHDGVLSFSFERSEDVSVAGPLTRWPRAAAAQPALAVRVGQEAYDEPNLDTLKALSTSDWHMLHGLPRLVVQGLKSASGPWPVEQPDIAVWQAAAKATLPAINDLPVALRHNAFKIQGATNLPGYENLEIQLSHLDLDQKRFENFEFRFACNLGTQGEFGLNARLEFFKLKGAPVFEQWAPNYRDGHRERLDLVFVFPSTLNLKEFSALSTNDRALVLLLADLLPSLLADLSPNGLALNRPLEEWTELAQKLRSFVRARLDVTGVQKQPGALVDAACQAAPSPESDASFAPKRRSTPRGVQSVPLPPVKAVPKAAPMPLKLRQK